MRILIVGAGFAGAVAAREAAEAGFDVTVIDKRDHIAGNAYDEVDGNGVRLHRYGPHLFHTSNMDVVDWLSRFTDWIPYEHRVSAVLDDGRHLPLPVNRRTFETFFGTPLDGEAAVRALLETVRSKDEDGGTARSLLAAQIGPDLTELLFGRYTRKMWSLSLDEIDPNVVRRIPIRTDDEDRYFPNDRFQALPKDGYTALFDRMLDHERIAVQLSTAFDPAMLADADHAFLCMPIDEYFGFSLGELPYRSIRFHHQSVARAAAGRPTATVNFTDTGPYTRVTSWHMLPGHWVTPGDSVTETVEEPCDYRDNGYERYYPVKTADDRYGALYRAYQELAQREPKVTFIGRCGTYQYLDMHQVVNQTLAIVRRWLQARGASET